MRERRIGMRTHIRSIITLLLLGMVFVSPVSSQTIENAADGKITGSVINGTTGEQVSGIEMILKQYERDQEKAQQKILSDSQGNFSFPGLDRRKMTSYILYTIYQGIEYYSPVLMFNEQTQEIPFEITVYEPTDSDQKISVAMHHVLVEQNEGVLWIKEIMIVENRDNKVYVGAHEIAPTKKETLRISLPPQAQELQLLQGLMDCCTIQVEDGLVDTMEIKPGRKEFLFAYKLDNKVSSVNLSKNIYLMTDSMDFFISDQGIQAEGVNLEYVGSVGESGKQYLHFSGKQLPRGSQVTLSLKSSLPRGTQFSKKIVPIVAVVLLGLGLIYPLIQRRKKSAESQMETELEFGEESGLQEERQRILWAIAELDDQLDSSQISQEEHDNKRGVLKKRIVEVTKMLQKREVGK